MAELRVLPPAKRFLKKIKDKQLIAVRSNGDQLCAIQEIGGISGDVWYEECKEYELISYKEIPDDLDDTATVLIIEVRN